MSRNIGLVALFVVLLVASLSQVEASLWDLKFKWPPWRDDSSTVHTIHQASTPGAKDQVCIPAKYNTASVVWHQGVMMANMSVDHAAGLMAINASSWSTGPIRLWYDFNNQKAMWVMKNNTCTKIPLTVSMHSNCMNGSLHAQVTLGGTMTCNIHKMYNHSTESHAMMVTNAANSYPLRVTACKARPSPSPSPAVEPEGESVGLNTRSDDVQHESIMNMMERSYHNRRRVHSKQQGPKGKDKDKDGRDKKGDFLHDSDRPGPNPKTKGKGKGGKCPSTPGGYPRCMHIDFFNFVEVTAFDPSVFQLPAMCLSATVQDTKKSSFSGQGSKSPNMAMGEDGDADAVWKEVHGRKLMEEEEFHHSLLNLFVMQNTDDTDDSEPQPAPSGSPADEDSKEPGEDDEQGEGDDENPDEDDDDEEEMNPGGRYY